MRPRARPGSARLEGDALRRAERLFDAAAHAGLEFIQSFPRLPSMSRASRVNPPRTWPRSSSRIPTAWLGSAEIATSRVKSLELSS